MLASSSSTEAPTAIVTQCRIDIRMIDLVQPGRVIGRSRTTRERERDFCQLANIFIFIFLLVAPLASEPPC